jgi:hypothetical protein
MRSARSDPRRTSTLPSRDGTGARGRMRSLACFQKTDAAVKDQAPRAAWSRRGDDPAFPRGKEQVPEGTKIRIAAARPSSPGHRGPARPKAPPTDRLGRSNRSAAGCPTWRPMAPVSRPRWSFPGGDRLAADDEDRASRPRLQDPVTRAPSREDRLAADNLCGAPRPAFKARKSWPFRKRDHHSVGPRDGASRSAFKTR